MIKLTIVFWLIFWLFVYKLAFLEKVSLKTDKAFTIFKDADGIPHIYAKTYPDILFGLGHALADDRLFSIFIKKMLVEGRIGQLFGGGGVLTDLEMRNIGFMHMARTNLAVTDEQTVRLIQAYADGINQYARSLKMLPMQFYLFWLQWEDWTVQDTLAYINFLSFNLEFDWFYEIARQRLLETVGFDLGVKIITYGSKNIFRNVTILSDDELKKMGRYKEYDYDRQRELLKAHWEKGNISMGSVHFPNLEFSVAGSGSNAWVVGGEHTKSGKPILANDPHLASLIPSLFYCHEIVLLDENNNIKNRKFGAMADGIPSVSIGVGKQYAWASTAAYIDNKDVYYQTVRNNSGTMQYLFKDQWHDFKLRKEVIKVRGGEDIQETYYHTHRGVVLESIFMELHWKYGFPLPDKYKDNHTITLNALHFQPDNSSARGHLLLLTGQTFEDYFTATKLIQHPNIDSAFIIQNGTYGYNSVGSIPVRDIPEMGSFIKDGRSDLYDMKRVLTDEEEPFFVNPEKGYFGLANNKFASDHYQFRSSLHEINTARSFRLETFIQEKLQKNEKFDFDTMVEMQLDRKDQFVAEVLPNIVKKLEELKEIWQGETHQQILKKLKAWDCVLHKNSIEASFYQVWQHLFHQTLFKLVGLTEQEMAAITNHGYFDNYQFTLLEKIGNNQLTDQERPVCESIQTKKFYKYHPCEASVALAFRMLPQQLEKLFGSSDIAAYQWGTIHNQYYKIIPYDKIPLLNRIWQRNFPTGGNSRTLNVAITTHQSQSYNSLGTPVFRMITDINRTYFSIEVGQSDRVSSPFYDNFLDKDRYVEYVPANPFIGPTPKGWAVSIDTLGLNDRR